MRTNTKLFILLAITLGLWIFSSEIRSDEIKATVVVVQVALFLYAARLIFWDPEKRQRRGHER